MKRKTLCVTIKPDTLAMLDRVAAELNMNRSRLIEMLILALCDREEGKK